LTDQGEKFSFNPDTDKHIGRDAPFSISLPIPVEGEMRESVLSILSSSSTEPSEKSLLQDSLRQIIQSLPKVQGNVWFKYNSVKREVLSPSAQDLGYATGNPTIECSRSAWRDAWSILTRQGRGDTVQHHIPETLARISPFNWQSFPKVNKVGAFRRIGGAGSAYNGLNGEGLIGKLLELQNPEFIKRKEAEKFDRINQFIRDVVGDPNATMKIPSSGREIQIQLRNKLLPLDLLGTGIHELVIFAAAATVVDDQILCIEEPEIHLHPRLQRKLLHFLAETTSNQYFITTHSAHLLDFPGSSVFHLRLNDHGETEVQRVRHPDSHANLCYELGYRPSDLLQANCVLWVEGPSDRVYINSWIRSVDENLVEGTHYSIMFYGGRLLSHLTAEDPELEEFISLKRLNRRMIVVMDSDRRTSGDPLSASKRRVIDELERSGGWCWVTAGREIENYTKHEYLQHAVNDLYGEIRLKKIKSEFDCCYLFSGGDSSKKVDKVKLAREVASKNSSLTNLDLKEKVTAMVNYIRESNV
jgi:hypothetical protein